jgi:hypothetical protein
VIALQQRLGARAGQDRLDQRNRVVVKLPHGMFSLFR